MTRIPPVRRLLMDAKALISNPECWIKGKYVRSAKGNPVKILSRRAFRFCAHGAVLRAGAKVPLEVCGCVHRLLGEHAKHGLITFNDAPTTTHPMVMKLFNKAIRRAKEQGI